MEYAPAFFDLQLRFAGRAAQLACIPAADALLRFTHLFIRLGCGRLPQQGDARWQAYVAGLGSGDELAWTCAFRARHAAADTGPELERSVGCFGYARLAPQRVRLHFAPAAVRAGSPLARTALDARRRELEQLLRPLARSEPDTEVLGASWLYHLPNYRALFPSAYLQTAEPVVPPPWQRMPLWGQLLDRQGAVREPAARHFREQLEVASTIDDLARCFRFPVLGLRAPAAVWGAPA